MLGIGWSEMLIIAVIVLVVLGPEKLPELAKLIAKVMRDLREVTEDVRIQFDQATREVRDVTDSSFLKDLGPTVADHYPPSPEHHETEEQPEMEEQPEPLDEKVPDTPPRPEES